MKAQLGPWTPSRQDVTTYPVCVSCWMHSGVCGGFTENPQGVMHQRKGQKSKYLSLQSPSRLNRLPTQPPSKNTQCLVRYFSWNMYPCRITTDRTEGSHESQCYDDRNIRAVRLPNFGSFCHVMQNFRPELCGCQMQKQVRSKLSSTWGRENQWD